MISHVAMLAMNKRTATSKYVVSVWYIPQGSRYDQAKVVTGFFDAEEREEAERFVQAWENPPEIATMLTIEEHDKILCKVATDLKSSLSSFGSVQPGDYEYSQVLSMKRSLAEVVQELAAFNPETVAEHMKEH